MDCYLDIIVEPDSEISAPALMNNLFAKLHRALVMHGNGDVAISFPHYNKTLGDTLRLHGTHKTLSALMAQPWLKGLRDYLAVGDLENVPSQIKGYRTQHRVQQKSPMNLRKRSIAKGWLTESEALQRIPDTKQKILSLPFLQLRSQSTGQEMRLFIRCGELVNEPTTGTFSSYGLSKTATIPWF